ncbi:type IV pilin protein [Sinimarinibacterium thermocellulolyticum]|uniref:Type IV pilin protein n=1 Tax=Sinimarinibacterium thermocellulolyticum TaxID=3170016 RepID=A0ABV2A894_9GAMM
MTDVHLNFGLTRSVQRRCAHRGFSLIELVIVVAIVGILAAIAYPSYRDSVVKSKRRAAQACLSEYAAFMERFYTTNLRYNTDLAGNPVSLPALDCASAQNAGQHYTFRFPQGNPPTATRYTLQAVPIGAQAQQDAKCGSLSLDQSGARSVSGSAGVAHCW